MSTPGVGAEGLALYEPADVVIADALPEDDRKLFHRPIENFSNCQTKANTLASWISVLEKPDVSTAVFVATSYSGCPEPNGGPASLFRSSEDRWATNISAARPVNGRIRSAATAVWAELMNRYGRLVRSTVASFRLQPADAEDAVQSTWLRVLERIDTLRDPECLGSWLATTASRECLALLRRRNREVPDDLAGTQLVSTEEGPDAAVVTREIHQAVNTAVGELSERRQTLTQLLFYQPEHSYAEVSHATGMPQGSIGPTAYGFCGSYATRWSSVVSVRYRSSALATTKLNLLNHCGRARL